MVNKVFHIVVDFVQNTTKSQKINILLTKTTKSYYNNGDLCLEVEQMKRTYQPNNRKKAKRLGFFARKKTNILNRRRRKGRKSLCK